MLTGGWRSIGVLLVVLLALLALALWRLNLTYDLGYFLPAPQSDAQRVLVERLGQNPGADLVFVQLPGVAADTAAQLAQRLRADPHFRTVWPDAQQPQLANLPPLVFKNRLLLGPLPQSQQDWQALLDDRLADVSSAADAELLELIAADPALLSVNALQPLRGSLDSARLAAMTPPLLVLRSAAGAFDIDAQVDTYQALQTALRSEGIATAKLYGSGVYAVELQSAVRRESIVFSVLASAALAALIFWRFRSLQILLGAALPLAIGGVAGLLTVSLLYPQVHGITLAFGFTLLGVALDYPLHLFSHHKLQPNAATDRLWQTLRLGIFSTMIAYGAFLLSGASGLMQLGLFASVGIASAAAATAYLDRPTPALSVPPAPGGQAPQLNHAPWLLAVAVAVLGTQSAALFNDDLGAMTPVPKATLAADGALRAQLGTVDLRHVIAVRGATVQSVLETSETLSTTLEASIAAGELERYQSVTSLLPSVRTQQQRRARLQDPAQTSAFEAAVANSAFQAAAFAPFTEALAAERTRDDWLTAAALLKDPQLGDVVRGQLYETNGQWVSLVFVSGLQAPRALAARINQVSSAALVDLKAASVQLVRDYRSRLVTVVAAALVLVGLMLWLRTGDMRRAIWLLGTMLGAVAIAVLGNVLLGRALSLFDLMALALVAGLGLDYALFYSRDHDRGSSDRRATQQAVLLCAASSLIVFGFLSQSSIPLLNGIGTTVAIGVTAAYLLARSGRYEKPTA